MNQEDVERELLSNLEQAESTSEGLTARPLIQGQVVNLSMKHLLKAIGAIVSAATSGIVAAGELVDPVAWVNFGLKVPSAFIAAFDAIRANMPPDEYALAITLGSTPSGFPRGTLLAGYKNAIAFLRRKDVAWYIRHGDIDGLDGLAALADKDLESVLANAEAKLTKRKMIELSDAGEPMLIDRWITWSRPSL